MKNANCNLTKNIIYKKSNLTRNLIEKNLIKFNQGSQIYD